MSLLQEISNGPGYSRLLTLRQGELTYLRDIVDKQWRSVLRRYHPDLAFNDQTNLENYHTLKESEFHSTLWPKKNRIVPYADLSPFKRSHFFKKLHKNLGSFYISNEDQIESEEVYWRLVRPDEPSDVGPIHADRWFWDLGHGQIPSDYSRIKVWIPLLSEPGKNGLLVVPHSQKKEWSYQGEMRDGRLKPRITDTSTEIKPILLNTKPGDAIVFHDNLLHGGALNSGTLCRVSLEFTIIYHGGLS